jgi:short-subunit dehydrogenase
MSLYSGAKHALHGFFEALRNEESGISITIACPGLGDPEIVNKQTTHDRASKVVLPEVLTLILVVLIEHRKQQL